MVNLLFSRFCLAICSSLYLLATQVVAGRLAALPLQTKEPSKLLSKRGVLQDLYATVPARNKVRTGEATSWANDVNAAAVYAPTEFYGCTLVGIVNRNGVLIGHFARERPDNIVCMDDDESVKAMIDNLNGAEFLVDFDNQPDTHAWIIYSDDIPQSSQGYRAIYSHLHDDEQLNIPSSNITLLTYRRSGGSGNSDKLVVQWTPNSDNTGATLNVYIRSDNPAFTGTYDCKSTPVVAGGGRLMARGSSNCALVTSSGSASNDTAFVFETFNVVPVPVTATPFCSYVAPEPPVINEALCSCEGGSYGLSTVSGTPVTESASYGYTALPNSTISGLDSDPATTDLGACQVCTLYAENGSDCTSIPNCTRSATPTV